MGVLVEDFEYDFLIVGTGIAALRAAIELDGRGQVLMLTKGQAEQGSTVHAQGGIAAAVAADDAAAAATILVYLGMRAVGIPRCTKWVIPTNLVYLGISWYILVSFLSIPSWYDLGMILVWFRYQDGIILVGITYSRH